MKKISVKDIKKGMSRNEMRSVKGAGCGYCAYAADCPGGYCCYWGNGVTQCQSTQCPRY